MEINMENKDKILAAVAETGMTAEELAETCGLPENLASLVMDAFTIGENKWFTKYYAESERAKKNENELREIAVMALRKICQ